MKMKIVNLPSLILAVVSVALILLFTFCSSNNQTEKKEVINIEENELWYGAAVNEGDKMPFSDGYKANLNGYAYGNQASPLLISNKGRYIWSEGPFAFEFKDNQIIINENSEPLFIEKSGNSLKEAYLAASSKYFPPKKSLPELLLFSSPQYNTWIELIYNQNQEDILDYAHQIIDNGFPPGVLMIDDNWAPYYGRFEFRKDRFPDAKAMVDELHNLGFKVMLWICPFIRPDSEEARYLMKNKWVIMDNEGDKELSWEQASKPAIVQWWNGFSMLMDFTNPEALEWYQKQLDFLMEEYGVDGFKLDAGDPEFYRGNKVSYRDVISNEHARLWGELGLKYPLNEYRAMWKMGNEPLVERLRDKYHTWEDAQKLIPHITTSSLLGYAFSCPDMIGGGDYSSFIDIDSDKLDPKLIVRSAQIHALMPMMQFSVAPWRILDKEHFNAVKKAVELRQKFVPEILSLAEISAKTGMPIVSNMEFVFPDQGFSDCKDQFMLGEDILVAPITTSEDTREVRFPLGSWMNSEGEVIEGGQTIKYNVALDELLWFRKM